MKKLLSLAMLIGFITIGCNSQAPNEQTEKKNETSLKEEKPAKAKTKENVGAIKLNKEKFLAEIVDYVNNPNEWNYKGELPALIDFYADWCRPCRITSPILDELAIEYAGKINIFKIDTQVEKELAQVFGIQSLPSFLFIPVGDKPVMSAGIASTPEATKEMFRQQIEEILLSSKISQN